MTFYGKLHLAGNKRVFPYRFYTQERALLGGMRGVGLGALLGLSDFRRDAFATGLHGYLLQRKYPHAEIAFSCPRLRPIKGNTTIYPMGVGEAELLQICCAYRLLMPSSALTVSTREVPRVRGSPHADCGHKDFRRREHGALVPTATKKKKGTTSLRLPTTAP